MCSKVAPPAKNPCKLYPSPGADVEAEDVVVDGLGGGSLGDRRSQQTPAETLFPYM